VDDGALQSGFSRLAIADIDVAAAAVDTVDHQLLAVIALVGEPARTILPAIGRASSVVGS
jgi:hypothetical protein